MKTKGYLNGDWWYGGKGFLGGLYHGRNHKKDIKELTELYRAVERMFYET